MVKNKIYINKKYMRIRVISRETFNEILVNVPENIRVRDFKRKIYEQTGDNSIN